MVGEGEGGGVRFVKTYWAKFFQVGGMSNFLAGGGGTPLSSNQ